MSISPPEPEFLIQWREWMREWMRAGPPKCCFTCDEYDASGHCRKFEMRPPEEFASSVDACDQWVKMIPF